MKATEPFRAAQAFVVCCCELAERWANCDQCAPDGDGGRSLRLQTFRLEKISSSRLGYEEPLRQPLLENRLSIIEATCGWTMKNCLIRILRKLQCAWCSDGVNWELRARVARNKQQKPTF